MVVLCSFILFHPCRLGKMVREISRYTAPMFFHEKDDTKMCCEIRRLASSRNVCPRTPRCNLDVLKFWNFPLPLGIEKPNHRKKRRTSWREEKKPTTPSVFFSLSEPRCSTVWEYFYTPLKLTDIAPKDRSGPKRKRSYSNHLFSGATLVSGRVYTYIWHQFMGFM